MRTKAVLRSYLKLNGFTMIELLMVIMLIGILGAVALPQFLDFRKEARVAAAEQVTSAVNSALQNQRMMSILKCGNTSNAYPPMDSILQNDITAGSSPLCTSSQIVSEADRKFTDSPLGVFPENPTNGLTTIAPISILGSGESYQNGLCGSSGTEVGWCYDQNTGMLYDATNTVKLSALYPSSGGEESSSSSSEESSSSNSEESSSSSGPPGDIGAECSNNSQCISGYCTSQFIGDYSLGSCTYGGVGDACVYGNNCQSGRCALEGCSDPGTCGFCQP